MAVYSNEPCIDYASSLLHGLGIMPSSYYTIAIACLGAYLMNYSVCGISWGYSKVLLNKQIIIKSPAIVKFGPFFISNFKNEVETFSHKKYISPSNESHKKFPCLNKNIYNRFIIEFC